ncbi:MAG: calcium-binding protein [Cyanobacteria bacterium P01_A01_bin.114]
MTSKILGTLDDDFLEGTDKSDIILADQGNDIVLGGDGKDIIKGQKGDDVLLGDGGKDILTGGSGNDLLVGGEGSDVLRGGKGSDILDGFVSSDPSEIDRLTGGRGGDIFRLGSNLGGAGPSYGYLGEGYAILTDFDQASGDKIQIAGSVDEYTISSPGNISGGSGFDTLIYKGDDLVAIVLDTLNVSPENFIV